MVCAKDNYKKAFNKNKITKLFQKKIPMFLFSVFRFVFLLGLTYVVLFPIISSVSIALRDVIDIKDPSVIWIPKHFTIDNIILAIGKMNYFGALGSTVFTGVVASLLQVTSCALVGYGLARFDFKFKGTIFALVILTMIIPQQILIVPTYLLYHNMGLLDTNWCLFIPAALGMGLRSGLLIYIFRQFYRNLPKELENAALVDGCNHYSAFIRVIIPSVRSAILTVFLFSFVWYYNDTTLSSMYFFNKQTLNTALSGLQSALHIEGQGDPIMVSVVLQSGGLLSIIPIMLVYVFCHRFFTRGIEHSGLVG